MFCFKVNTVDQKTTWSGCDSGANSRFPQVVALVCILVGFQSAQLVAQMPGGVAGKPKIAFEKLFKKTEHEFGTVARAAKAEHVFKFKNTTGQTIQLAGVAAASNCANFKIRKKVIKPGETGEIVAQLNSRSFLGSRRTIAHATFVKPHVGKVALKVKGYVRRDIVVQPPSIEFNRKPEGKARSVKVAIEYAGNNNWKIEKATPSTPDIEVELKQTHRGNGLVGYEMIAKLRPMVGPERLKNCVIKLKTNDNRLNEFSIMVSGDRPTPKKGK